MSDEEDSMAKRSRWEKASPKLTANQILSNGFKTITERIEALENTVKKIIDSTHRHSCCDEVLRKLDIIEAMLRPQEVSPTMIQNDMNEYDEDSSPSISITHMLQPSTLPVVLVSNQKPNQVTASLGLDSTVQVVTLNSESDYEDGSWLGDETNTDSRVRCPISPSNLLHINTTCTTPEKMAIKLLDYLFPPEVLAVSNLSGRGKHGKHQLNPLMVFGIRCHLMQKFAITEGHWFKIKQNIDSKCRTAWRKKSQGLPLGGKRKKSVPSDLASLLDPHHQLHELVSEDGESIFVTTGPLLGDNSGDADDAQLETKMLQMPDGDIKVLHATPEQLLRLQQRHHFRVFTNDQLLPVLDEGHILCEEDEEDEDDVSAMEADEQMLAIVDPGGVGAMEDDEGLEYVDIDGVEHVMVGSDELRLIVDGEGEGLQVPACLITPD